MRCYPCMVSTGLITSPRWEASSASFTRSSGNRSISRSGHVLYPATGSIHGVDHGVSFHIENKLRTVLWGWTGKTLIPEATEVLTALAARLDGDLGEALEEHLTISEVQHVRLRIRRLLRSNRFPKPPPDWPAIPWPPV